MLKGILSKKTFSTIWTKKQQNGKRRWPLGLWLLGARLACKSLLVLYCSIVGQCMMFQNFVVLLFKLSNFWTICLFSTLFWHIAFWQIYPARKNRLEITFLFDTQTSWSMRWTRSTRTRPGEGVEARVRCRLDSHWKPFAKNLK